jgi:hypothetical protein
VRYIHDTLTSMVQVLSAGQLSQWLSLCKAVLTVQQETTDDNPLGDADGEGEGDDDQAEFHADQEIMTHPPIQPRWPTRVRLSVSDSRIRLMMVFILGFRHGMRSTDNGGV